MWPDCDPRLEVRRGGHAKGLQRASCTAGGSPLRHDAPCIRHAPERVEDAWNGTSSLRTATVAGTTVSAQGRRDGASVWIRGRRVKLLKCDGRVLEVFEVSDEPIYRLTASTVPLKAHGLRIVTDVEARTLLQDLRATKLYEGGRIL